MAMEFSHSVSLVLLAPTCRQAGRRRGGGGTSGARGVWQVLFGACAMLPDGVQPPPSSSAFHQHCWSASRPGAPPPPAGAHNVRDEGGPLVRPVLLQNVDQHLLVRGAGRSGVGVRSRTHGQGRREGGAWAAARKTAAGECLHLIITLHRWPLRDLDRGW